METLNDLIWTDEDNDNGINTQSVEMYKICMYAFCEGIVGHGGAAPRSLHL